MKILLLLLMLSTKRAICLQTDSKPQETTTEVTPTTTTPEEHTKGTSRVESPKVGSAAPSTNCDRPNQKQEVVVIFVNKSDIHREHQANMENTVSSNNTRENNTTSESMLGSAANKKKPETKLTSAVGHAWTDDLEFTDTNNYETLASFRKKLFPRPLKVPRIHNRIPSEPIACETLSEDEAALNQALIGTRRRIPRPKFPKRPQNSPLKRVYTPITTTHNEDTVSTPCRSDNSNNKNNNNNNIRYGSVKTCIDNNNPNPYEQKPNRYALVGNRAPSPRSRQRYNDYDYSSFEPAAADLTTFWNDWNNYESVESSENSRESPESLDYLIDSPNFFT